VTAEDNHERSALFAALERIRQHGIPIPEAAEERLWLHADLVRRWTRVCGLVSVRDESAVCSRHTCDSLGLIPVYQSVCPELRTWVDIGSGGGFPALPAAIMLPEVSFILYERSRRKSAFLERAIPALELEGRVVIREASFPCGFTGEGPMVFTARAVEKPEQTREILVRIMPPGSVYLAQGQFSPVFEEGMFHVEHEPDDWPWRRGDLAVIRRIR